MGRFFCTCSPNSWRTCVEDSFFVKLRTYSLLLCWKLTFFCRFSMSYLYSCALVIIRSSHWEVFCKNTCGTASCPPTNSLCTCDSYPWKRRVRVHLYQSLLSCDWHFSSVVFTESYTLWQFHCVLDPPLKQPSWDFW